MRLLEPGLTNMINRSRSEEHQRAQEAVNTAAEACRKALGDEQHRFKVITRILEPTGGASGIAESLVQYSKLQQADGSEVAIVLGSRGLGAWQRYVD